MPVCSVRRNADREVNAHGLKMLTLCKSTGLRIVNGRTDGDREGAFTFVSSTGGASSVDNVLACPSALPLITRLHVVPAAFTDLYAIKILLSTEGSRVSTARVETTAWAPRMVGAANIKRWLNMCYQNLQQNWRVLSCRHLRQHPLVHQSSMHFVIGLIGY